MKYPCKDCNNRFVGCHSKCELYKKMKEEKSQEADVKYRYMFTMFVGKKDSVYRMQHCRSSNNVL